MTAATADKITTDTNNFRDLMRWLGREIAGDQAAFANFATTLTKDPAYALGWNGSKMITTAANLHVCQRVLMFMQDVDVVAGARNCIAEGTRDVFDSARRSITYSDPTQAAMKAEIAARWARVIDPKSPDGLGEMLRAMTQI